MNVPSQHGQLRQLASIVIERLPAYVLALMSAAFVVAYVSGRAATFAQNLETALLLPLLCLFLQPGCRFNDGLLERWFIVAALLGLWLTGVQCLQAEALPSGWHRLIERAAALAVCLFVAVRRVDARQMIAHLGRSAVAVTVLSAVVEWHYNMLQPMSVVCFGLAHINVLVNTAGPTLVMWLVLLSGDWFAGKRTKRLDWMVLAIGCAGLATIAITTQRRGVLLAIGATVTWLLLKWLWRCQRWLAWLMLSAGAVAGTIILWRLFSVEVPSLRNGRIDLYRSALEGIGASWPWGFGQYGFVHLQTVVAEHCRHLTACGGWGIHAHDEFLDITLDGGVVALIGMVSLIGILITRLGRIRDSQVANALQVVGVVILMLMLTDNIFGTMAGLTWLAVVTGVILGAPVGGRCLASLRVLPSVRMLAWPLSLLALLGVCECFSTCILNSSATAAQHLSCLEHVYEPQLIDYHALFILKGCQPPVDALTRTHTLDLATSRYGWKGDLAVLETQRALAAGEAQTATTDILRVLRFSPFYEEYYGLLQAQLVRHHDFIRLVPMQVQRRLAYLVGDPQLPAPRLDHVARTIDDAADAYAGIIWSITNGVPWSSLSLPLENLCRFYGDIPGVASLVIKCARFATPGTFPWLAALTPNIQVALCLGYSFNEFELVNNAQQARGVMPLIEQLYPGICADCRAGKVFDGDWDPQRKTIDRIWHLGHPQ